MHYVSGYLVGLRITQNVGDNIAVYLEYSPYVSLGAGAVLYHIAKQSKNEAAAMGVGLQRDWEFAMNAGGGFKYLVQNQFALTFNVKDQVSGVLSYGLPRSGSVVHGFYQPGVDRHGLLNNWHSISALFISGMTKPR